MAQSPTHRFGQIIGDVLEVALRSPLGDVAGAHGLFLDWKRPRAARGGQSKVRWKDVKGNFHDLDYVLEQGGNEAQVGHPRAFIEIAYRRYTKHSKNKAQEIQGAITPLCEAYSQYRPFIGVVLGGVFTDPSLTQLRSHGFGVLYLPFDSIVAAFKVVGIDAYFDEDSADADVQEKVDLWDNLPQASRVRVGEKLRSIHKNEFAQFLTELEKCLKRTVASVLVMGLHGDGQELASVTKAITFIEAFDEKTARGKFVRYEVMIRYTNSDEVRGTFNTKAEAVKFLKSMA